MSAEPIPLRRFYVYVLKRADGEAFYVGRGTGGRMMQHLACSHNDGVNARMNEAVAGDERITAEVVSWHFSAVEAAAAERETIEAYPPGVLANKHHARRDKCSVRLTDEMHARLERLANKRGVSLAEVLRVAVAEYMERAEVAR